MGSYSTKEIISDPTSEGAKYLIGKEVIGGRSIKECLRNANVKHFRHVEILEEIRYDSIDSYDDEEDYQPFKTKEGHTYSFLMPRDVKKEKSDYQKFRDGKHFIRWAEQYATCAGPDERYMAYSGIWLVNNNSGNYEFVVGIKECGVDIVSDQAIIFKTWKELLREYKFPAGKPCGYDVSWELRG